MTDDMEFGPLQAGALERSPAPAPAEQGLVNEQQVQRFAPPVRREIRRLIRSYPRVADLIETFPGLLYALAVRHGPPSPRLSALHAVETGAPLKAVARTLGLPMWLRKLPPEDPYLGPGVWAGQSNFGINQELAFPAGIGLVEDGKHLGVKLLNLSSGK